MIVAYNKKYFAQFSISEWVFSQFYSIFGSKLFFKVQMSLKLLSNCVMRARHRYVCHIQMSMKLRCIIEYSSRNLPQIKSTKWWIRRKRRPKLSIDIFLHSFICYWEEKSVSVRVAAFEWNIKKNWKNVFAEGRVIAARNANVSSFTLWSPWLDGYIVREGKISSCTSRNVTRCLKNEKEITL